jgi:hypothetical protein
VRAAAVGVHDLLDRAEAGLELHAAVLVHGDVAGHAPVGGGEQRVVGGGEAHLERKADRQAPPLDRLRLFSRGTARGAAAGATDEVEQPVLDGVLLQPPAPRRRARLLAAAPARARERGARVGKDPELEVVGAVGVLVEPLERRPPAAAARRAGAA